MMASLSNICSRLVVASDHSEPQRADGQLSPNARLRPSRRFRGSAAPAPRRAGALHTLAPCPCSRSARRRRRRGGSGSPTILSTSCWLSRTASPPSSAARCDDRLAAPGPRHARLRLRPDVLTRPSPTGMRRLAVAGLVANGFIVVSGGLVRLTKSGLGCPTWPRCTPDSLLPAAHTDVPATQMAIEFGNRMLTFVLLAVGVLVFVAAVHLRSRRPDLARLAVVQPLGILAQGALGGRDRPVRPASSGRRLPLPALRGGADRLRRAGRAGRRG